MVGLKTCWPKQKATSVGSHRWVKARNMLKGRWTFGICRIGPSLSLMKDCYGGLKLTIHLSNKGMGSLKVSARCSLIRRDQRLLLELEFVPEDDISYNKGKNLEGKTLFFFFVNETPFLMQPLFSFFENFFSKRLNFANESPPFND